MLDQWLNRVWRVLVQSRHADDTEEIPSGADVLQAVVALTEDYARLEEDNRRLDNENKRLIGQLQTEG